jgi:hypothetical protein
VFFGPFSPFKILHYQLKASFGSLIAQLSSL